MKLTAEGCRARRLRLLEAVEADLIVINNTRHIQYLSGLYISPLGLSGWGPNFLLLESTGRTTLLAQNFLGGEAAGAYVDDLVVWRWYDAAANPGLPLYREGLQQLNSHLARLKPTRLGVESGWLPGQLKSYEPVDITDALVDLRRVKDSDELALMRATIRAIEAGHAAGRRVIRPGLSEMDVFNAVCGAIQLEAGAPALSLGDYVSGERTRESSGPPTARILEPGDLMILDIYPVINGYRADFTATLTVDGSMPPRFQALEAALHAALQAGENLLRAGSRAGDVYDAVKASMDGHGFGQGFTHHAGHGLGLGHPEAPYLVPNSDEVLAAGDVVTLEPGSYGDEFGARIEHNYLILEDGFER
ncbi:MAG: Xaa-Pro peptidase family protein, partial [Anaerolineales bacterium]|nr:Xaa-Pro peptidase family protein [Anaerolineales bacterium]